MRMDATARHKAEAKSFEQVIEVAPDRREVEGIPHGQVPPGKSTRRSGWCLPAAWVTMSYSNSTGKPIFGAAARLPNHVLNDAA